MVASKLAEGGDAGNYQAASAKLFLLHFCRRLWIRWHNMLFAEAWKADSQQAQENKKKA
jgi:hypothetical protein